MNNVQKSMRDIAFEILSKKKKSISFNKLWKEVVEVLELTEEEAASKIGAFYTQITLDGRFVLLKNNTWDLRSNHKYNEIKIDMNDLYNEEDNAEDVIDDENENYGEDEEDDDEEKSNHKDIYEYDDINDI